MEKGSKNKNLTLALALFMSIITVSFTHNISCMDFNFLNIDEKETENTREQSTNESELIFPERNVTNVDNQQGLTYNDFTDNDFPEINDDFQEPNNNLFTFNYDEPLEFDHESTTSEPTIGLDFSGKVRFIEHPKIKTSKKKVYSETSDTFKNDKEKYRKLDHILYTFNYNDETRNTFKNNNEMQHLKTTYGENIEKDILNKVRDINLAIINKDLEKLKTIIKTIEKRDKTEKKPLLIKILNTYQAHNSDSKPINKAINKQNIKIIQLLLEKGAIINNYTINKIAISKIEILKYFLAKWKIDLNSKNKSGQTPICKAALYGKFTNFKYLKKNGAKTSIIDNYGNNILHFAAKSGSPSLIKYILENNMADIHQVNNLNIKPLEILLEMFLTDHTKKSFSTICSIISQNGIDINKNNNPEYKTNLIYLIQNLYKYYRSKRKNIINKIKFLIKNGTDINAQNYYRNHALYYAIKGNELDIIKLLLDQGAKLDIKINEKEQSITFANGSTWRAVQHQNRYIPPKINMDIYNLLKEALIAQNELKSNLEKLNKNLNELKLLKSLEKFRKAVNQIKISEKKTAALKNQKIFIKKIREDISYFNTSLPLYDKLRALNTIVKSETKITKGDLKNILFNYDLFNSEELKPLFKEIESYPKLKDINGSFFYQAMLNHANLLPYLVGKKYTTFFNNNNGLSNSQKILFDKIKHKKKIKEDETIVDKISKKIIPFNNKNNKEKSFKYNKFHKTFLNTCTMFHELKSIKYKTNNFVNFFNKKEYPKKSVGTKIGEKTKFFMPEIAAKILEYTDGKYDGKSYGLIQKKKEKKPKKKVYQKNKKKRKIQLITKDPYEESDSEDEDDRENYKPRKKRRKIEFDEEEWRPEFE